MTLTSIMWERRKAMDLSPPLHLGVGGGPMHQAGSAWIGLAVATSESAHHVDSAVRLMESGWSGGTSDKARAALRTMSAWLDGTSATAMRVGQTAQVTALACDASRVAMPTMAEITAVQAAKAASVVGATTGALAAAEAAERLLDLRAIAAMRTYDAASAGCSVGVEPATPPRLTTGMADHQASDGATASEHLASADGDSFDSTGALTNPVGIMPGTAPAGVSVPGIAGLPASPLGVAPAGTVASPSMVPTAATVVGRVAMLGADAARAAMTTASPLGAPPLVGPALAPASEQPRDGRGSGAARAQAIAPASMRAPGAAGVPGFSASLFTGAGEAAGRQAAMSAPLATGPGAPGPEAASSTAPRPTSTSVIGSEGRSGVPMMPPAAMARAEEDASPQRARRERPRDRFDVGPSGQLVCPAVIGGGR
ncbi:PPE domain-containing protein [Hoyosella sp. G463]|uniref:PPE domain-containing protein n=1 Tax=Lolliginicoccus lacisalsi TaxID=2742202 RepID=A0A927JCZ2_9ACTN|nr:PPE domain-containing protein [Lolliginicoccus lacisalsi]MBD8506954.1 PPE domain-containing protein [Lolliginicoccus lacisalsi]